MSYGATTGSQFSGVKTVSDPQIHVAAKTVTVNIVETTGNKTQAGHTSEKKDLLLSKYDNTSGDSLKTYYLDNQNLPVELASSYWSDTHVLFKTYDVVMAKITDAETLEAIRGKNITIKASALTRNTPQSKNPGEEGYTDVASDAIIQLVAYNGTLNGYVANSTAASGTGVTFAVASNFAGGGDDGTVIAKIAIRVDGDENATASDADPEEAQDLTNGTKDASFFVSVSVPADGQ